MMVKVTMENKDKNNYPLQRRSLHRQRDSKMYSVSDRTVRRWRAAHDKGGIENLRPKKTGPKKVKHAISKHAGTKNNKVKGAVSLLGSKEDKASILICSISRRIVHRVLKKHGLLIRIKAKP